MSDEKKNGRITLPAVLAVLGIIGGPLAVWGESQLERGETKQRLSTIEKRQDEDRREIKERLQRIEDKSQRTDDNVQLILRKLDVMDAAQRRSR